MTGLAAVQQQDWLCSGARDCTLRLWDTASGTQLKSAELQQNVVTHMSAVPGEASVLQTGEDLHIRVWDARTMQPTQLLPAHQNIPLCCACSDNGLLPHVYAAVCPLSPWWLACCAHIGYPLPMATTVKQTATELSAAVGSAVAAMAAKVMHVLPDTPLDLVHASECRASGTV